MTKTITIENFATIPMKAKEYSIMEEIAQKEGFNSVDDLATVILVQKIAEHISGKQFSLKETRLLLCAINVQSAEYPDLDFEEYIKNWPTEKWTEA